MRHVRKLKQGNIPAWPLPPAEAPSIAHPIPQEAPHYDVLIGLAIEENRPQDVLHWYDRRGGRQRDDDPIACAIVEVAPDRAIEIWRRSVDAQIAHTKPRAYEVAAGYLRKIRRTLTSHCRETEWNEYLEGIRAQHRRKRRLLEILDGLQGKPIVASPGSHVTTTT
jgi:uncharacterized Zn finger protein